VETRKNPPHKNEKEVGFPRSEMARRSFGVAAKTRKTLATRS